MALLLTQAFLDDFSSYCTIPVLLAFANKVLKAGEEVAGSEASVIAISYGYSRDHREDLKQWMLALATTQEGDVPLFLRPRDWKQQR